MGKVRQCKICLVQAEVDESGRCRSCAAVKAASDAGIPYGKYMAQNATQKPTAPKLEVDISFGYRECAYCKKRFYAGPSKRIYCSDECYKQKNYEQHRKKIAEGWTPSPPGTPKECPVCGKLFVREGYARGTAKYCSDECRIVMVRHQKREARAREKARLAALGA